MLPVEDEELLEQGGGDGVIGQHFEETDDCQKTENRLMLLVTRRERVCICERMFTRVYVVCCRCHEAEFFRLLFNCVCSVRKPVEAVLLLSSTKDMNDFLYTYNRTWTGASRCPRPSQKTEEHRVKFPSQRLT